MAQCKCHKSHPAPRPPHIESDMRRTLPWWSAARKNGLQGALGGWISSADSREIKVAPFFPSPFLKEPVSAVWATPLVTAILSYQRLHHRLSPAPVEWATFLGDNTGLRSRRRAHGSWIKFQKSDGQTIWSWSGGEMGEKSELVGRSIKAMKSMFSWFCQAESKGRRCQICRVITSLTSAPFCLALCFYVSLCLHALFQGALEETWSGSWRGNFQIVLMSKKQALCYVSTSCAELVCFGVFFLQFPHYLFVSQWSLLLLTLFVFVYFIFFNTHA